MNDVSDTNDDQKLNVPLHYHFIAQLTCEPNADADDCVQCLIVIIEQECGWEYRGNQNDSGGKQRYFFRRMYTTAIGLTIRRHLPSCIDQEFIQQGLGASQTGYKRA